MPNPIRIPKTWPTLDGALSALVEMPGRTQIEARELVRGPEKVWVLVWPGGFITPQAFLTVGGTRAVGSPEIELRRWAKVRREVRSWHSDAACSDGCPGWVVTADREIERCDSCARFPDDDAALAHVRVLHHAVEDQLQWRDVELANGVSRDQLVDTLSLARTLITDPGATDGDEAVVAEIDRVISAEVGGR